MRLLHTIVVLFASLFLLGWLGLQVKAKPFPAYAQEATRIETVPLPTGLPAPVDRFYQQKYGDQVPVIKTIVIAGRGRMRLFGLNIPIRFRFSHEAGRNYRHDVDLAFFGQPLIHSYETFLDGKGWARTPGGVDEGAGTDQGSNVSLWAEALNWFPAVLVTDERVQWQAVDECTALLIVPFGSSHETFVVRFDPESGLISHVEAIKYKSATHQKTLWINGTWFEEGRPWIQLDVEDRLINVDVEEYIRSVQYD